jgi:hypothetical protein
LKLEVKIENDTPDDCKKIILDEVYTGYIRTIQDDKGVKYDSFLKIAVFKYFTSTIFSHIKEPPRQYPFNFYPVSDNQPTLF